MSTRSQANTQYGDFIAEHYAAYRPPLHQDILSLALPRDQRFAVGLDVGSGTGYSAIALTNFCDSVFGVEPSDAMREKAVHHEKIRYLPGSGEAIPLRDSSVDVATFAGSLFYIDVPSLIPELQRVCRNQGYIVAYDFEVLLEPVLVALGVTVSQPNDGYNHTVNLSGVIGLDEVAVCHDQIRLPVTSTELSHILLASPDRYSVLAAHIGRDRLFDKLVGGVVEKESLASVGVSVYYSSYQLNRKVST